MYFIIIIVSCLIAVCFYVIHHNIKNKRKEETADYYDVYNKPPRIDIDTSPFFDNSFVVKRKTKPYIMIFDTETAELADRYGNPSLPVSISWLLLDENLNVLDEKEFILKQKNLSPKATYIHKISHKMLEKGADPQNVIKAFCRDMDKVSVIVAHNIEFHVSVIKLQMEHLFSEYEDMKKKKHFCTMLWGTKNNIISYKGNVTKYPSLTELFGKLYFDRYNIEVIYKSKTKRDVRLVLACLRKIKQN